MLKAEKKHNRKNEKKPKKTRKRTERRKKGKRESVPKWAVARSLPHVCGAYIKPR
jgi:hypothetical protein